jgi:hypothetical protein
MSVVLALQEKVRVSVCGRLLDVKPESCSSLSALRRELATQIKLATPTSLQLADSAARTLRTDDDLTNALRDGRYPLQAKLTVVAVHEIEQKKHEAEAKKEELVQLQWQIVVEQVGAFSQELQGVASQLQKVKDDCWKAVRTFEEQEELRRKQLLSTINHETAEREAGQRDMFSQVERAFQVVAAERSARDVADHQLQKQMEQMQADLDLERSHRVNEQAELDRKISSVGHALEIESHKNSESHSRGFEQHKRSEVRQDEHQSNSMAHNQRIQSVESESEKMKAHLAALESHMNVAHKATMADMKQRTEETTRAIRDGIGARENDVTRLAKDLETSWQALEVRVQKARDESNEGHQMMLERTRALEQRCNELEAEVGEHRGLQATKNQTIKDEVSFAVDRADKVEVDKKANDVILRTMTMKVEDLMARMRSCENDLAEKAHQEQVKPHLDSFYRVVQKQEQKITSLERDVNARFTQEANHRESVKNSLQDSLKNSLEKVSTNNPRGGVEIPALTFDKAQRSAESQGFRSLTAAEPIVERGMSIENFSEQSASARQGPIGTYSNRGSPRTPYDQPQQVAMRAPVSSQQMVPIGAMLPVARQISSGHHSPRPGGAMTPGQAPPPAATQPNIGRFVAVNTSNRVMPTTASTSQMIPTQTMPTQPLSGTMSR